jgi:hypothetical protein
VVVQVVYVKVAEWKQNQRYANQQWKETFISMTNQVRLYWFGAVETNGETLWETWFKRLWYARHMKPLMRINFEANWKVQDYDSDKRQKLTSHNALLVEITLQHKHQEAVKAHITWNTQDWVWWWMWIMDAS